MKEQFRQINILYLALAGGQVAICAVLIFLLNQRDTNAVAEDASMEIYKMIIPFIVLFGVGAAWYMNRLRIAQGATLKSLEEKVQHFRTTVITRSALIEGPNLLVLILAFLLNQMTYFAFFALGFAAFLYFRPTVDQFIRDYQISGSEEQQLRQAL